MAEQGKWKRLGDGSLITEDADEGLGHIVPLHVYRNVYFTLVGLTVVTVLAALFNFGELANIIIAILIASVKVALVASFFMHLRWEGRLLWVIATYPVLILGLLMLGTAGDAAIQPDSSSFVSEPPASAAPADMRQDSH